jgi:NAD(P)-dependent dehydrogenase (short-subunit alcohol dehydrogenase family)
MADVLTGPKPPPATLLTGFDTPLGRSVAVALARAGQRLCVIRADGPADLGLPELPGHERLQHQGITADLSDPVAVQRAAHEAEARLGQVTALLHVVAPRGGPAADGFEARHFSEQLKRGPAAFLGLCLELLPEMLATQSGSLCVLSAATPPGGSSASAELGSTALLGALLGAVRQVADRCAGTPLRSLLFCGEEPASVPLPAAALAALTAQFSDAGSGWLDSGSFLHLSAPRIRGTVDLLGVARPALPAPAASVAAAAPEARALPAAQDRVSERLAQTFRATFGLAASVDLKSCVVGSVPRWDSLGHLKLMMEVERSLRVRLPAEALAKIQSYRDLEQAVRAHLSTL